jgi:hypothetical protein
MKKFETIEVFKGDETSINPNIVGTVSRVVVEVEPVATTDSVGTPRPRRALSPKEREMVLSFSHIPGIVSEEIIAQARAESYSAPVTDTADVGSYSA